MTTTTLDQVQDYIADARTLLQDTVAPYRYDDASLLIAFNTMILEARRLRPDLFIGAFYNLPQFTAIDDSDVPIEQPFRLALLYGAVAHALMRDQEDIQDARGSLFMGVFNTVLTGVSTPSFAKRGQP